MWEIETATHSHDVRLSRIQIRGAFERWRLLARVRWLQPEENVREHATIGLCKNLAPRIFAMHSLVDTRVV